MKQLAESVGLTYTSHQYGQHRLQNLKVWQFAGRPIQSSGYWVIYIHGGAWRDPKIDSDSFWPSAKHIVALGQGITSRIRGFMSIDYRLSPHPAHPQDSNTAESQYRGASHPDHIQDVFSALDFAHTKYNLASDYVLVGHSAGATLAFQLIMGEAATLGHPHPQIPLPTAIIGISGIYDLIGINERHNGEYAGFISGAFRGNTDDWASASPRRFKESYGEKWTNGKLALLAWSPDDTLIDEPEIENMASRLRNESIELVVIKNLQADHDVVWQDGSQVGRLVSFALEKL